jgi:hypothetical protein
MLCQALHEIQQFSNQVLEDRLSIDATMSETENAAPVDIASNENPVILASTCTL